MQILTLREMDTFVREANVLKMVVNKGFFLKIENSSGANSILLGQILIFKEACCTENQMS